MPMNRRHTDLDREMPAMRIANSLEIQKYSLLPVHDAP